MLLEYWFSARKILIALQRSEPPEDVIHASVSTNYLKLEIAPVVRDSISAKSVPLSELSFYLARLSIFAIIGYPRRSNFASVSASAAV